MAIDTHLTMLSQAFVRLKDFVWLVAADAGQSLGVLKTLALVQLFNMSGDSHFDFRCHPKLESIFFQRKSGTEIMRPSATNG